MYLSLPLKESQGEVHEIPLVLAVRNLEAGGEEPTKYMLEVQDGALVRDLKEVCYVYIPFLFR